MEREFAGVPMPPLSKLEMCAYLKCNLLNPKRKEIFILIYWNFLKSVFVIKRSFLFSF